MIQDSKLKLRNLHPRIHWVDRGTGTPEVKDEVIRQELSECEPEVLTFLWEVVIYHESRKRELKIRLTKIMNEGRCDERLNVIYLL